MVFLCCEGWSRCAHLFASALEAATDEIRVGGNFLFTLQFSDFFSSKTHLITFHHISFDHLWVVQWLVHLPRTSRLWGSNPPSLMCWVWVFFPCHVGLPWGSPQPCVGPLQPCHGRTGSLHFAVLRKMYERGLKGAHKVNVMGPTYPLRIN